MVMAGLVPAFPLLRPAKPDQLDRARPRQALSLGELGKELLKTEPPPCGGNFEKLGRLAVEHDGRKV